MQMHRNTTLPETAACILKNLIKYKIYIFLSKQQMRRPCNLISMLSVEYTGTKEN